MDGLKRDRLLVVIKHVCEASAARIGEPQRRKVERLLDVRERAGQFVLIVRDVMRLSVRRNDDQWYSKSKTSYALVIGSGNCGGGT